MIDGNSSVTIVATSAAVRGKIVLAVLYKVYANIPATTIWRISAAGNGELAVSEHARRNRG